MENTLIAVVVALIILLICREIVCWYYKINAIERHLVAQRRTQDHIYGELRAIREVLGAAQPAVVEGPPGPMSPAEKVALRQSAEERN